MKNKPKRQKLANNPYLSQEAQTQPQHLSVAVLYKIDRLNNSMYSPQETYYIPDYQVENKKLKEQIALIKQESSFKQISHKQEIQILRKNLDEKQIHIQQLEQQILEIEKQARSKNQNLIDRINQCGEIVKQLQENQFKSSAHNMLETSRIQKFNILDQTKINYLTQDFNLTAFNVQRALNLQQQNRKPHSNIFSPFERQKAVNPQKDRKLCNENVFVQDKKGFIQDFFCKRQQSPGVIFNYTPPKIVYPQPTTYNSPKFDTLNKTINYSRNIHQQNKTVLPNNLTANPFPNHVKRVLSPPNISGINQVLRPLNIAGLHNEVNHKK